MNAARKAWTALRPGDRPAGRRATADSFSFWTKRQVVPGVQWKANVHALSVFWVEKDWEVSIKLYLYDREVAALMSRAEADDYRERWCVSFDVLAAADFLERQDRPWAPPAFSFEVTDDAVSRQLAAYSRRVDRLWQFAGGQDLAAFRKLAIWIMRNPGSTGSFRTGLGMICAAWAYGEPKLAASLLEAYEAQWEEQLQDRAYDVQPNARAQLQGQFSRLRSIIGLSAKGC